MRRTLIAVYDEASTAHHVVDELVRSGVARSDIGLAMYDPDQQGAKRLRGDAGDGDVGAGEGAAFGALVGGLTGLLVSVGALMIPGIGPIIAAGPLVSALAGAGVGMGAGAVTGGIVAGLVDLGVPGEEAGMYAEAIRRGSTLVTATMRDHEVDRATAIMQRRHPVNMDERVTQWRAKGWEQFNPAIDPFTAEEISHEREMSRQHATAAAGAGTSGSTDTPRAYSTSFDMYYDRFRQHYLDHIASSGMTYEQCAPAYRRGYTMGVDPANRSREWSKIEPEARRAWERSYPHSPWESFKNIVRYAWKEGKDAVDGD